MGKQWNKANHKLFLKYSKNLRKVESQKKRKNNRRSHNVLVIPCYYL